MKCIQSWYRPAHPRKDSQHFLWHRAIWICHYRLPTLNQVSYHERVSLSKLNAYMLWVDQEIQPSPFLRWRYNNGYLWIVNMNWWRNSEEFLIIFNIYVKRWATSLRAPECLFWGCTTANGWSTISQREGINPREHQPIIWHFFLSKTAWKW